MAVTFAAGQKIRASDLNAIAATGVQIAGQAAASTGDTLSLSTTEAVKVSLSAVPFVTGRKYLIEFSGVGNSSAVGANMFLKLKYKAGSVVDTSGTVVPGGAVAPNMARTAGDNHIVSVRGFVTAPTTGPYVIVLTGAMSTGTGTIPADNSVPSHWWTMTVTCVDA
ncbi:hypothetical protein DMC63_01245 [Streptomyces sp. WAC 05977]|nr:hypothetical protein DMC63_01245 [Streptomyces sp. WAC 05977]